MSYKNTANREVIVNKYADLPKAFDTGDGFGIQHRTNNSTYIIGANITSNYGFAPLTDGDTSEIFFNFGITFTYTGTGSVFNSNTTSGWAEMFTKNGIFIGNSSSTFANLSGRGAESFYMVFSIAKDFNTLGTVENMLWLELDGNAFINFNVGLTLDCIETLFIFNNTNFYPSSSMTGACVAVDGTTQSDVATITTSGYFLLNGNQKAFDIKSTYQGVFKIVTNLIDRSLNGIPFASGSLDYTSPKGYSHGNTGVPPSQILGSIYSRGNTIETNITIQGYTEYFQSAEVAGGNTQINTTDTTGFTNGDDVWFPNTAYVGKYTISNLIVNTSFEINIAFKLDTSGEYHKGWIKVVGNTLANDHNQRASQIANNEISFENLEQSLLDIKAEYSVASVLSSDTIETCIVKNGEDILSDSIKERGITTTVGEGSCSGDAPFISGDTSSLYTRNMSNGTRNILFSYFKIRAKQ